MPPSRQPKRNYLETMHRVAAGLGRIGKEITRGGPSPKERMSKLGYGVSFTRSPFGRKKWTAPSKQMESYIGAGRFARHEKDAIRQMIKNAVPEKQRSLSKKGINWKDMEEALAVYEKKFGSQVADDFRKAVGLQKGKDSAYSMFSGGREAPVEKVLERLQTAKWRVGKWNMPFAEQVVQGLYPAKYQKHRKTFDQPKAYGVREEIGKTLGSKAQA